MLSILAGKALPDSYSQFPVYPVEQDLFLTDGSDHSDDRRSSKLLFSPGEFEEDEVDHSSYSAKSSQVLFKVQVHEGVSSSYSFVPATEVKLYLLYSSWKSFLHV